MKLVKFSHQGIAGEGVLVGEEIRVVRTFGRIDVDDAQFTLPARDDAFIVAEETSARETVPLGEACLAAPISPTSKIICLGYNYKEHVVETRTDVGAAPALFARWSDSLVGHGHDLIAPAASSCYDFEGEIAIVIGKGGRRIRDDQAIQHVSGYTCLFDGSVRDYQKSSPTAGKNFPRSGAIGPWIVTRDEAGDPRDFRLQTRVNGQTVQSTSGDLMIFGIPAIISYVSEFTELSPGDVIATGTPGGVGAKRMPPLWLKEGDVVEVFVSSVGILRNRVIAEAASA